VASALIFDQLKSRAVNFGVPGEPSIQIRFSRPAASGRVDQARRASTKFAIEICLLGANEPSDPSLVRPPTASHDTQQAMT
jgi:hypothetical protein